MARTPASAASWVPKRLQRQRLSRSDAWLIARPSRLLIWWIGLFALVLLGVVLVLTVLPGSWLPGFLVAPLLLIGVDAKYIPRVFRAWRSGRDAGR